MTFLKQDQLKLPLEVFRGPFLLEQHLISMALKALWDYQLMFLNIFFFQEVEHLTPICVHEAITQIQNKLHFLAYFHYGHCPGSDEIV